MNEILERVQPYLSMDFVPDDEEPIFHLRISTDDMFVELSDIYEGELRSILRDIKDQLELQLSVFRRLESTAKRDEK